MEETMNQHPAEIDRLKAAFAEATTAFLEQAEQKLALAHAINDDDQVVKEQIKVAVMKSARSIFQGCYWQMLESRMESQNDKDSR
jgi:hypothetical protein